MKEKVKSWTKTKKGDYIFSIDGKEAGMLAVSKNTLEADAELHGKKYKIKRTSYWKLNVEVTDETGKTIIKMIQQKWYSHKWDLEYNFKKYKVVLKNKYFAQYSILDGEKEILVYGLTKPLKCEPVMKITSATEDKDLVLDLLMWFIYAPVVEESTNMDWIIAAVA